MDVPNLYEALSGEKGAGENGGQRGDNGTDVPEVRRNVGWGAAALIADAAERGMIDMGKIPVGRGRKGTVEVIDMTGGVTPLLVGADHRELVGLIKAGLAYRDKGIEVSYLGGQKLSPGDGLFPVWSDEAVNMVEDLVVEADSRRVGKGVRKRDQLLLVEDVGKAFKMDWEVRSNLTSMVIESGRNGVYVVMMAPSEESLKGLTFPGSVLTLTRKKGTGREIVYVTVDNYQVVVPQL